MGVTLTQSHDAGFADRPGSITPTGLRAVLELGDDGQSLGHAFPTPIGKMHVRCLMRRISLAGGAVVVCRGFDAAGREAFRASLDDAQTLSIQAADGVVLSATLRPIVWAEWDCIEFGFDATAGTATLWVNGIEADQHAGLASSFAVADVAFGVPQKHHDATGELHLDEWMMGDGYLGPVLVTPHSDHADDPARWLVVYNAADADAQTWAEAYRTARGIPHANLLGLSLSLDESISLAEYTAMLNQIETYLDLNALRPQVMGLLLGYRVPGYVDNDVLNQKHPIGSLLHTAADTFGAAVNPVAQVSPPARPTTTTLAGVRLTARLDAPTLSDALALSQRAQAFDTTPLTAADQLLFDPIPRQPPLEVWSDQTMAWYSNLDRQRLRLNTRLSGDPVSQPDANFAFIEQDAIYWGWGRAEPATGFFGSHAGPRALCVQLRQPDVAATTLRSATPTHWIDRALDAGYAAAIAASQPTSASDLPNPTRFFAALRQGWTLAEAWLVSQAYVRSGMYLVGDPLLTLRLPRAGWDVFGPLARSEDLNHAEPIAALPADANQLTLDPSHTPSEDSAGQYLVRRVDHWGRSEASFQPLSLGQKFSTAAIPPPYVAWPWHDRWNISTKDGNPKAQLMFVGRPRLLNLERLELLNDQNDSPLSVAFDHHEVCVESRVPLTATFTRYRWRLTAPGGLTRLTPWSAPIRQESPTLIPLTTPES